MATIFNVSLPMISTFLITGTMHFYIGGHGYLSYMVALWNAVEFIYTYFTNNYKKIS